MRDGIRAILEQSGEFEVVGEAETGVDAVTTYCRVNPDVLLMEIALPQMNGIDAAREILGRSPDAKVVILSINDDENTVLAAFRCGVRAFLRKEESATDLLEALRAVCKGGLYWSARISDLLLIRLQRGDFSLKDNAASLRQLSRRELQILRLLAKGHSTREVAAALELEVAAVRTCRRILMKKLKLGNVADLARFAFATGLTTVRLPEIYSNSHRDDFVKPMPAATPRRFSPP